MPFELIGIAGIFTLVGLVSFSGIGYIETGNVGVEQRFGVVHMQPLPPGLYIAPFSLIKSFSVKEIRVDIDGLTPKASDNLFIREFSITVYYRVEANKIPIIETKYAGQSILMTEDLSWAPVYKLVEALTRNATYQEVSKLPSLVVHQQRGEIAEKIKFRLQHELDNNDKNTFFITRVIIRTVITDPAIEESIQRAVANQKQLEAMELEVKIAEQEALVRLRKAEGIAKSNQAINNTLTPEYLQHEANEVMMEFARKGGSSTIVIPSSMNAAPLINIPSAHPAH